ncbi:N-acetylmuramoyl-L-alanine amidase [Anaerosolibacter carboniphilus]|uniref:N-acetylmuramoyl-L-alanine amidase n=1 Tax=Anaerosolibacter carboniphilus TaxID=1417629 RepID=A0A841KSS0_9FIRM|nr:N-acetylmuramoyl-L-alanine amidase family protein [Anaerosolibacter carboniphilus]MBB6213962.1 N-acetylmuramoyl-L-alanine amidase [Anaerosolibacter carboniphilus]
MKKLLSFLLVITMLLGMQTTVYGAKFESDTIEVVDGPTNKKQEVYVANLLMGGKDVLTDVPTMLYKNRTLVPIAFVVENLGAKIQWNQDKYEATITTSDKTIVLKIDSATAYVNGSKTTLPDNVPAKLLGYQGNFRTMVPLRFVSEQLGMNVNWIAETRTAAVDLEKQSITGITYESKGSNNSQIRFKTTGKVSYTSMYLEGSKVGGQDRIVVDIPSAVLNVQDSSISVEGNGLLRKPIGADGVSAVRASVFEPAPRNVVRLVVDLEKKKSFNIGFDAATNELKIDVYNPLNTVKEIALEQRNNMDAVVIRTEDTPQYNVMDLGNRVVIDVLNAQLKASKTEMSVSRGSVSRVRSAVFTPDQNYSADEKIVRVVLDLEPGQSIDDVVIEDENKDILIYVGGRPLEGVDYRKETFSKSVLKMSLQNRGEASISYNESSRELNVRIEKSRINWESTNLNISDKIVESIEIDGESDNRYYEVKLRLAAGTGYTVQDQGESSNHIVLGFENYNLGNSKYNNKIVVLDAGHGGKDPGASGVKLGLKEKELALDVSKRLEKLLQDAGFMTFQTRTDDTYIGLYDRPGMANNLGADAFVSIHFNWHPDPSVTGVQMLYNADPSRDSKTFARIMQEESLKELGAVDRKIVERPNLVVIRETKMPAVLGEMGFISNEWEESQIASEEYRQKIAQALFNGITRYFDEVVLK